MSEIGSFLEMKDINGSTPEVNEFRKIKPEEGTTFKDSQDFWDDFFGSEIPIDDLTIYTVCNYNSRWSSGVAIINRFNLIIDRFSIFNFFG